MGQVGLSPLRKINNFLIFNLEGGEWRVESFFELKVENEEWRVSY